MRLSRRSSIALVGAVLVAGVAGSGIPASALDPAPGVSDLTHDLDQILDDPRLAVAQAGVVVKSAETGEDLYSLQPGKLFIPASNTKLVTSAAAVETLGLDYRFSTTVLATSKPGRSIKGDLVLKGTGDPTMLAADYDALAAKVARSGVKEVTGRLVADDTWFDDVRLGADWTWDDEPYYYAGQISALTTSPDTDFDAGSVIVSADPGSAPGKPAKITTTPPTDYLKIVNKAVTGTTTNADITREHGTNTVVISGTVADRYEDWISVWDPTLYTASLFRAALARHGVRVHGPTVRGAAPGDATTVADHRSMPLGELLVPFMKLSNNMHAEILTKAMGRKVSGQGTWAAGLAVTSAFAQNNGVPSARLRDGSGLSRIDGLTPSGIASLLVNLRAKPWFQTWYRSLPVAGESERFVGGTLSGRMAGTAAAGNVHAKTGSLTGVSALSGYVTSADGEPLVFSVISNGYLSGSPKDLEDKIAVRLAEFKRSTAVDGASVLRVNPPVSGDLECSWRKPVQC
ncbi:D-alanyl-D-alanine carboxypeptidase/D-alanyl-D-alanine endopeptidase [Planotetraspora kaengkrachanensis]|uniref:D-alanyl-D-alanine carboxypeptidase/D-alanyl-D-alanine endopeptidase n=1 Tax=Planotetraspora kaengkrachanensis TaxID=575193 RepID=UPI001942BE6A|nr:D-alanyl-D-alanine carboxypeptidase/D-alanyl-D-alanine-endopeptidase [Planotetraspora kaengkrachanensis]